MELTVKDISSLLMVTEKEILSLIKKHEIPFKTINDKELFNKQQVIEWALIRNMPLNISNHEKMNEYKISSLSSVLSQESFFYNCDFHENDYIKQMVHNIDIDKNVDKEIIIQLLINREELMSTSIGNGISLPHPRIPLIVGRNKPLINFFFLKNPLNLKSLDGKPVHTLILLISQTIKQHLSILAHISYLISNVTFHSALEKRLDYKQIIDIINHIESIRNDK